MSVSRFVRIAGEAVGPLSPAEIRQLALDGKITPDTAVSRDGKRWVRAGLIAGLLEEPEAVAEADAALVAPPITPPPPPLPDQPPAAVARAWESPPIGMPVVGNPDAAIVSLIGPPATSAATRSKLARLSSERSYWQALAIGAAFVATTVTAYQIGYQQALQNTLQQNSLLADASARHGVVAAPRDSDAARVAAASIETQTPVVEARPTASESLAPALAKTALPKSQATAPPNSKTELAKVDPQPLSPPPALAEPAKTEMPKPDMPTEQAAAAIAKPAESQPLADPKPAEAAAIANGETPKPDMVKADMPKADMAKADPPKAGAKMKPVDGIAVMNDRQRRRLLVIEAGGTAQSEAAVEAALVWLTEHQMADGGWSFDHRQGLCKGQCDTPGAMADARNGATALALLPLLAAGNGLDQGPYQKNVAAGLNFLIKRMDKKGSLYEPGGRMYSHGLATIALCDACEMMRESPYYESPGEMKPLKGNRRPRSGGKENQAETERARIQQDMAILRAAAQKALDFVVTTQNKTSGGWRYEPGDVGDTSVVAWQLMALKAGHLAELKVPQASVRGAASFLNSVQGYGGSTYSYLPGGRNVTPGANAAGLYCQIVLARDRNDDGFARGAAMVANTGMLRDNMYYNFYATQLLRHFGGANWEKWNPTMRDFLVMSQRTKGHESGSWIIGGNHASAGGRLYDTALACLTLEVYYRYKPAYESPGEKLNPPAPPAAPAKDEKPALTSSETKLDAAMLMKQQDRARQTDFDSAIIERSGSAAALPHEKC